MNQTVVGIILGFSFSSILYIVGAISQYLEIKRFKTELKAAQKELNDFKKIHPPTSITVDLVKEYYLIKSAWGFYGLNPDVDDSSCYWIQDPYKAIRFSDYFDLDMFVRSTQYRGGNMPYEIVKLNMFTI